MGNIAHAFFINQQKVKTPNMDGLLHFLEIFAFCVCALIALAATLFFAVLHLPDSPLKTILAALRNRLGATAATALIGLPLQPIPEIDGVYDIGAIILLAIYWYGMIHKVKSAKTMSEAKVHVAQALPGILRLLRKIKSVGKRR